MIKVLLVDDHPMVRDGLKVMLSMAGDIEVTAEAGDGKEALEKVRTENVDVILMDISMPGMNGIEATREIINEKPDARIIALTMHDSPEYRVRMDRSGASGYVLKCANMETLFEVIRNNYQPPLAA